MFQSVREFFMYLFFLIVMVIFLSGIAGGIQYWLDREHLVPQEQMKDAYSGQIDKEEARP